MKTKREIDKIQSLVSSFRAPKQVQDSADEDNREPNELSDDSIECFQELGYDIDQWSTDECVYKGFEMSDSFKICNKELHKRDRPKINYHYCASCKVMHVVGASVDISKPFNLEGVSGSVECVSVEMLKDTLRFCFSCWERGGVDRWVLDGRAGKANLSSDAKMDEIKKAHEVSVELASHVAASTEGLN